MPRDRPASSGHHDAVSVHRKPGRRDDLGCLPETPLRFSKKQSRCCVRRLPVQRGFDGFGELLRGGRAGADFLLSLKEETLWIADEVASTPVLIPRHRAIWSRFTA